MELYIKHIAYVALAATAISFTSCSKGNEVIMYRAQNEAYKERESIKVGKGIVCQ